MFAPPRRLKFSLMGKWQKVSQRHLKQNLKAKQKQVHPGPLKYDLKAEHPSMTMTARKLEVNSYEDITVKRL